MNEVRYLLDANPIVVFQRAGVLDRLLQAAPVVPMEIADDVHAELTVLKRKPGKPMRADLEAARHALLEAARHALDQGPIRVHEIAAGSMTDSLRNDHRRLRGAGPGEAGSIAITFERPELVFVTEDIRAAVSHARFYRKLPGPVGRIIGLHSFLQLLADRSALAVEVAIDVAVAAKTCCDIDPPLWWKRWIARPPPETSQGPKP